MKLHSALVLLCVLMAATGVRPTRNNTACSAQACKGVTLQHSDVLQKQFLDLKNLKEAYVIKLHVKYEGDRNGSKGELKQLNDTFDPLTWMWVSKYGAYIVDLPLDYNFVSLGLLGLKEYELDVIISDGGGCFLNISVECMDRAIFDLLGEMVWPMQNLGRVHYGEYMPQEYICRSVYAYPSFMSKSNINKAVGWKCCSYEDRALQKCHTGSIIKGARPGHQKAVFAFSILLSLGVYIIFHGLIRAKLVWYASKGRSWDWVGHYFGYGPTTYRTYILDIGPGNSKRWVHVSDEQLLQGENQVSLPELWQLFGGPFHSGRCIIVFKFIFVVVAYAAVALIAVPKVYTDEENTIKLLKDGEEVALNLRSVPLAWWKTNHDFWPRNFSILLLVGFFAALILELVLVLVFVIGFRRGPPKDFQRYLKGTGKKPTKNLKRVKNSSFALMLAVLFLLLDIILGCIIIAAVIYPLVQVVVHVCLAVIIYIDVLTPWVIAVTMTLFHIHLNFQQFRQPYADIKEILHAEFLDNKATIQAYTIWNIHQNKSVRAFKSEAEDTDGSDKEKPMNRIQKLPPRMLRTLLVTFQQDRRPTILMEHFLKVSRHLVNNRSAVWDFIVRLLLFGIYLAVIMSSITLYRSSPGGGDRSAEGLVTGAVVFVFLLLPYAYMAGRRKYKTSTCRLLWRLEIQRFLRSLETEWDGQFDSPEAKLRATFNRKQRREQWSVILEDDGRMSLFLDSIII